MCRFLPLASRAIGALFDIPLAPSLRSFGVKTFAKITGANLEEASLLPHEYSTLGEFFIRDLKPGLRPIGEGWISPVDGVLRDYGSYSEHTLFKAKTEQLSVKSLLQEDRFLQQYETGSFWNLYLAPRHYHHVHIPQSGTLVGYKEIPGTLYPVNTLGQLLAPDFPVRNARTVFFFESEKDPFALIMIGALNVGKISTLYKDKIGASLKKGERLGTFHLGSSVIVLSASQALSNSPIPKLSEVKMGISLNL